VLRNHPRIFHSFLLEAYEAAVLQYECEVCNHHTPGAGCLPKKDLNPWLTIGCYNATLMCQTLCPEQRAKNRVPSGRTKYSFLFPVLCCLFRYARTQKSTRSTLAQAWLQSASRVICNLQSAIVLVARPAAIGCLRVIVARVVSDDAES
jgi:hypothetical protein